MRALIRMSVVAALTACALLAAPFVGAQQTATTQLSQALGGLQQAAETISAGLQADTPAEQRQQAQRAIAILESTRGTLQQALPAAPSDFVRSRIEAVLDQLDEGLADLREGVAGPDESLDDKLREAEAQILEAIQELRPAVPAAPAVTPTPAPAVAQPARAGGVGLAVGMSTVALGSALALAGLWLRRR
ncbi:MAG TPA: hypothetical protein VIN09_04945 [Chloroflexota bacterium]